MTADACGAYCPYPTHYQPCGKLAGHAGDHGNGWHRWPRVQPAARPFLAELAEADGVDVVTSNGRVWGRPACHHRPVSSRIEITCTADIDAAVKRSANCLAAHCEARTRALAVLATLEAVGAIR